MKCLYLNETQLCFVKNLALLLQVKPEVDNNGFNYPAVDEAIRAAIKKLINSPMLPCTLDQLHNYIITLNNIRTSYKEGVEKENERIAQKKKEILDLL